MGPEDARRKHPRGEYADNESGPNLGWDVSLSAVLSSSKVPKGEITFGTGSHIAVYPSYFSGKK